VVDIGRLERDFGFVPRYASRQVVEDFAEKRRVSTLLAERSESRDERELEEFLQRSATRRSGNGVAASPETVLPG